MNRKQAIWIFVAFFWLTIAVTHLLVALDTLKWNQKLEKIEGIYLKKHIVVFSDEPKGDDYLNVGDLIRSATWGNFLVFVAGFLAAIASLLMTLSGDIGQKKKSRYSNPPPLSSSLQRIRDAFKE